MLKILNKSTRMLKILKIISRNRFISLVINIPHSRVSDDQYLRVPLYLRNDRTLFGLQRLKPVLRLIQSLYPGSKNSSNHSDGRRARGIFASLTDEEVNYLIKSKDADNTIRATKNAVGIFRAYLKEKNLPERFDPGRWVVDLSKASLDEQFCTLNSTACVRVYIQ